MSYREKDVICEFTKGNFASDCLKYNTEDLLDMFDETNVSHEYDLYDFTVNDCIENDLVTKDLVVVEDDTDDGMYVYLRNKQIEIPCSLELDYEFQNQSE